MPESRGDVLRRRIRDLETLARNNPNPHEADAARRRVTELRQKLHAMGESEAPPPSPSGRVRVGAPSTGPDSSFDWKAFWQSQAETWLRGQKSIFDPEPTPPPEAPDPTVWDDEPMLKGRIPADVLRRASLHAKSEGCLLEKRAGHPGVWLFGTRLDIEAARLRIERLAFVDGLVDEVGSFGGSFGQKLVSLFELAAPHIRVRLSAEQVGQKLAACEREKKRLAQQAGQQSKKRKPKTTPSLRTNKAKR
jgi:hypothetical protein